MRKSSHAGFDAAAERAPVSETRLRTRLGDILVERGLVARDRLEEALHEQARTHRRLGEVLVGLGALTPEQLTWALSGNGFVEAPNATYDRVIVRFADQLVADARNLGAAVDAEMIVESLASPTTFVTPGWSGFHGDLTWTKMP